MKKIYQKISDGFLFLATGIFLELLLFIIAFSCFLFFAHELIGDKNNAFDAAVFNYVAVYINGDNTRLMLLITAFGDYPVLVPANLLLALYFFFIKRNKRLFLRVPIIALGSTLVMFILKEIYSRPRPLNPLLDPAIGYSFPSGHSMSSVTFYGLLIYFISVTDLNRIWKWLIIVLLIIIIISIGISRIYLHVHFASDVIGGYCTGILWLVISIWVARRLEISAGKDFKKIDQSK